MTTHIVFVCHFMLQMLQSLLKEEEKNNTEAKYLLQFDVAFVTYDITQLWRTKKTGGR